MSKEAIEVVRAAKKASNALDTVADLIPMQMQVFPKYADKLQPCLREIKKSKVIVDLIRGQEGLQTSGVVAGIRMLQSYGEILDSYLALLGEDKDEHDLEKFVEKLRSERRRLIQQIRLASVGLTKAGGKTTVDTKLVESTDKIVKKVIGKDLGLDIALFLARLKRAPDADGNVTLSQSEYEELTWHQINTAHPETKTLTAEVKTRIVCNCLARGQSIQILGPVAVDLWSGIAFIKIEGLVSMDQAIQYAYPVTWDVFQEGLDRQDRRIGNSRSMGY